jgi:hypothetical protein
LIGVSHAEAVAFCVEVQGHFRGYRSTFSIYTAIQRFRLVHPEAILRSYDIVQGFKEEAERQRLADETRRKAEEHRHVQAQQEKARLAEERRQAEEIQLMQARIAAEVTQKRLRAMQQEQIRIAQANANMQTSAHFVAAQQLLRVRTQTTRTPEEPHRVFIGLPQHLVHKVLWVATQFRTNPLSRKPGGCEVIVEYHDGRALGYDRIKVPSAYIDQFFDGIVEYASSDFKLLDEATQIEVTKEKIARFFARKENGTFVEVWNSETSDEMPWMALRKFERQQPTC